MLARSRAAPEWLHALDRNLADLAPIRARAPRQQSPQQRRPACYEERFFIDVMGKSA
jgi:hypothetical protein